MVKVTLFLSAVVALVLLIHSTAGQFFTKTDKAVPRIGRRMDPALNDVPPITRELDPTFLTLLNHAPLRWRQMSDALYEGNLVSLLQCNKM